jgi:hypothetical protein
MVAISAQQDIKGQTPCPGVIQDTSKNVFTVQPWLAKVPVNKNIDLKQNNFDYTYLAQ